MWARQVGSTSACCVNVLFCLFNVNIFFKIIKHFGWAELRLDHSSSENLIYHCHNSMEPSTISQHGCKQWTIKARRELSVGFFCWFFVFLFPLLSFSVAARHLTSLCQKKHPSNWYCLHLTKNNLWGLALYSENHSARGAERHRKTQSSTFLQVKIRQRAGMWQTNPVSYQDWSMNIQLFPTLWCLTDQKPPPSTEQAPIIQLSLIF